MKFTACLFTALAAVSSGAHAASSDAAATPARPIAKPVGEERFESGVYPSMAFGLAVLALARRRLSPDED